MSVFCIAEGKRRNSKVYQCEGYTYIKDKEARNILYVKCSNYRVCPGRACINNDLLVLKKDHNHPASIEEQKIEELKSCLKRKAEDTAVTSLR